MSLSLDAFVVESPSSETRKATTKMASPTASAPMRIRGVDRAFDLAAGEEAAAGALGGGGAAGGEAGWAGVGGSGFGRSTIGGGRPTVLGPVGWSSAAATTLTESVLAV